MRPIGLRVGDTAERAQFRENMRGSLCRKKPLDLRRIKNPPAFAQKPVDDLVPLIGFDTIWRNYLPG